MTIMKSSDHTIGIFTTDASLVVRSWDEWLARVTGVSPTDAYGRSVVELFRDLGDRNILGHFQRVLTEGVVEVLASAFHHYLFACDPLVPSRHFDKMQQRVTIAPLLDSDRIAGVIVTVEDVTARVERERVLGEQLAAFDETTRLEAARALAEQEALESSEPLIDALSDQSWRVRRIVIDGLARHGGTASITSLLRVLRDEHHNPSVLNSALQVLALTGGEALTALVECLNEPDADLRVYAAQALGDQRDPSAIPALTAALADADANVRYHAIEALGKVSAVDAIDELIRVVESRDFYLAFPALDALTKIGESRVAPRLVPLLEDKMLRVPAAGALGQLGDEEVVRPLVALLNTPDAPTRVIAEAFAALYDRYERLYQEGEYIADLARQAIDATGAQNLLNALNDAGDDGLRSLALVLGWLEGEAVQRALTRLLGRATARKEVVEALVRHGRQATELLIDQLGSGDLEVRQAAVIALGRIGDTRAVPALVRVLASDRDLVIPAAGALAKIGDRGAFEALLELISNSDAAVRQAAVAAINSLGHPEMPKRALTLLSDPDPRVRESAVRIAGYFGYAECSELLLERCRDKDENVRRAAIEHIPYIEDERGIPTLADALENETPRVRASAAQALAQVEPAAAMSHLLCALDDEDQWVRYFAARSIGRHGYPEGLDALGRLAKSDPATHVRIAAMESLGGIGGPRAVAVLASLVDSDDPDLTRAALSGLGMIGHPDALPPLLAALRSPASSRRIDALNALGKREGPGVVDAIEWIAAADDDEKVVQAAIDALASLATPAAITTLMRLTSDPVRRDAGIDALARLGVEQIDLIGEGLSHPQPSVRRSAVEALGRIKNTRASDLLSKALDDEDASVRLSAVNALVYLDTRSAQRRLVAMARTDSDASVRHAAQKALRK